MKTKRFLLQGSVLLMVVLSSMVNAEEDNKNKNPNVSYTQEVQADEVVHVIKLEDILEGKYSKDENRKLRATGIADYLYPNSKWLSEVPNELKVLAREWMKKNNPFDINNQVEKGDAI